MSTHRDLAAELDQAKARIAELEEISDGAVEDKERIEIKSAQVCGRMRQQKAELRAEVAELTTRASRVPGLSATLDEYRHFARLVAECLAEHDAAKGTLGYEIPPDSVSTTRIREALAALAPVAEEQLPHLREPDQQAWGRTWMRKYIELAEVLGLAQTHEGRCAQLADHEEILTYARAAVASHTQIDELHESLQMACECPSDDCDCAGCSYAAEKYAKDQTP